MNYKHVNTHCSSLVHMFTSNYASAWTHLVVYFTGSSLKNWGLKYISRSIPSISRPTLVFVNPLTKLEDLNFSTWKIYIVINVVTLFGTDNIKMSPFYLPMRNVLGIKWHQFSTPNVKSFLEFKSHTFNTTCTKPSTYDKYKVFYTKLRCKMF